MAWIGRDKVSTATLFRESDLQLVDSQELRAFAKSRLAELCAGVDTRQPALVWRKNSLMASHETPPPIRHPTPVCVEREKVDRHRPKPKLDVERETKCDPRHQQRNSRIYNTNNAALQ